MEKSVFTKLVLEAETTLYHISKSILMSDDDCADAVQEAITKAFSNLHKLKQEKYFKTWLCRILINECYHIRRSQKKIVPLEDYMELEANSGTTDIDLRTAVMNLDENLRLVVVLHYIDGFLTSEVADILNIPVGTVKSRLSRARFELKSALQ